MRFLRWLPRWFVGPGVDTAAIAWMVIVTAVYGYATYIWAAGIPKPWGTDHMMSLAGDMARGQFYLDWNQLTTGNDIVTLDHHYYQAMSLLPTVPYLVLVPFQSLWVVSRFLVSVAIGIFAGWLALPVARRYGPGGAADYWLAALGAFGTLLFTLSIQGDFYYLAHLESTALIFLLLIEWADRRRPLVLGALIGVAGLARPTLWIVALPVGLALLAESGLWPFADKEAEESHEDADDESGANSAARDSDEPDEADDLEPLPGDLSDRFGRHPVFTALAFGIPVLMGVLVTGWFDWVRFGSPFETGYGISLVGEQLAKLRDQGLFSIDHVPTNVALFLGGGFDIRDTFPWLVPNSQGDSILLTTPALLIAFNAGLRSRTSWVLWASTILTAIPVFLYYGGGGAATYGYRYAMDFVPFLFALVCMAVRRQLANLDRVLIALSVAFVCYGFVWQLYK